MKDAGRDAGKEENVTQALIAAPSRALTFDPAASLERDLTMARTLIKSGLCPKGMDTPEKVYVAVMWGRELGIPPMQALMGIHVIQGRPTLSANLMLAKIQAAGCHVEWVTKPDDMTKQTLKITRPNGDAIVGTFTIEDAKRANLLGKDSWRGYPANMLRSRAISNAAKAGAADILAGFVYTPEEMGAEVDAEGEVIAAAPVRALPQNTEPSSPPADMPRDEPVDPDDAPVDAQPTGPELADDDSAVISIPQRRRLFGIAKSLGFKDEDVRAEVVRVTGNESTAQLRQKQYERVVSNLETKAGVPAEGR